MHNKLVNTDLCPFALLTFFLFDLRTKDKINVEIIQILPQYKLRLYFFKRANTDLCSKYISKFL